MMITLHIHWYLGRTNMLQFEALIERRGNALKGRARDSMRMTSVS
jgi:hypothetical protein